MTNVGRPEVFIREAVEHDIPAMHVVRTSVKENVLSDPGLITPEAYRVYITERGKGWIWEESGTIAGFAVVDLKGHNVWALFVHPEFEGRGIGRRLHDVMLGWYFLQTREAIWLSTSPGTRAEQFYRMAGWKEMGAYGKGEVKFEMTYASAAREVIFGK